MATKLEIIIKATDKATKTIGKVSGAFDKLSDLGVKLAAGGIGLATGGIVALGAAIKDTVEFAAEQQRVEQQLNAVLESTNHAAGLTAQEIKEMAASLQAVTTFGDEAIISGQNILLTFTNIGQEAFPQATQAMLDMSTALDQDLKTSAIQIGKALNDPVAGIGALSRAGIQFSENQQTMIQRLVETGDAAGAQKIILAELERQFGGSAAAAAEGAGKLIQLQNAVGDVKEAIGAAFIPILADLADQAIPKVNEAIAILQENAPLITDAFQSIMDGEINKALSDIQVLLTEFGVPPERAQAMRDLFTELTTVLTTFSTDVGPILSSLGDSFDRISQALSGISSGGQTANPALMLLSAILSGISGSVNIVAIQFENIAFGLEQIQKNLQPAIDGFTKLFDILQDLSENPLLSAAGTLLSGGVGISGGGLLGTLQNIDSITGGGSDLIQSIPGGQNLTFQGTVNIDGQALGNVLGNTQGNTSRQIRGVGGPATQ